MSTLRWRRGIGERYYLRFDSLRRAIIVDLGAFAEWGTYDTTKRGGGVSANVKAAKDAVRRWAKKEGWA